MIPELKTTLRTGGVYLGVGPEQNFTYIVALRPKLAFIIDIRRGNLVEQLLYKAFVEMSATRAEFLSRLFARKRPAISRPTRRSRRCSRRSPSAAPSADLFKENLQAAKDRLVQRPQVHAVGR